MSAIIVEKLKYSYCDKGVLTQAVSGISFQVEERQTLALVGPSGCGKTTLLHLVGGLIIPDEGKVICKKPTGLMLQTDCLFEWITARENILLGRKIMKLSDISTDELLINFGLEHFGEYYPAQLSGGMRQRVAMLRTLALDPEIFLLDEPFSALDYLTRLDLQQKFSNMLLQTGKTALIVTHDIPEAVALSDRIIVLTASPAQIKAQIITGFPHEMSVVERRNQHVFFEICQKVQEVLSNESVK